MKVLEVKCLVMSRGMDTFGRGWPACMIASRGISDDRLDSRHSAGVNVEIYRNNDTKLEAKGERKSQSHSS